MKVKINKRLINIAIVSFIIAAVLTFTAYKTVKRASEPEERMKIAYFKRDLERDLIINESDLTLRETPVSLMPRNCITNISSVVGKTLIFDVSAGDFALSNNFISRGELRVDVNEMWLISIDVDNISNFLGSQLKEGEYYALIFIDKNGEANVLNKVKLVNMVDATGKIITENGASLIKTINIAVNSNGEMIEIAKKKRAGSFELVRPSEEWKNTWKYEIQDPKDETAVTDEAVAADQELQEQN